MGVKVGVANFFFKSIDSRFVGVRGGVARFWNNLRNKLRNLLAKSQ